MRQLCRAIIFSAAGTERRLLHLLALLLFDFHINECKYFFKCLYADVFSLLLFFLLLLTVVGL